MRDARETLAGREAGKNRLPQCLIEAARNVVHGHVVVEADVLAQKQTAGLQLNAELGSFDLETFRKVTVRIGVGDAPAVNKDDDHAGCAPHHYSRANAGGSSG